MSDTTTEPRGDISYEELQKLWHTACEERDGFYRDNAELKVRIDEARAALQQAQAGWATLKKMAKDADGCEAFRLALLQIVDLSEHGKALLARLEEARQLLAEARKHLNIVDSDGGGWSPEADAWLNPKEGE